MRDHILLFLQDRKTKASSRLTIRYYEQNLGYFADFLAIKKLPSDITLLRSQDFALWLDSQRDAGLSGMTIQSRARAVKVFARWLLAEEYLEKDPYLKVKLPKAKLPQKDIFTIEQVKDLLSTCDRKTFYGLRDYAIMITLYSTGLRASELLALTKADIDQRQRLLSVRNGKGGKARQVPIGPSALKAIRKYLDYRKDDIEPSIFVTNGREPLVPNALEQTLARHAKECGIDHALPHKWRHTFAVHALRNGLDVVTLSRILGHESLKMTMHYARQAGKDLSILHSSADPARNLLG